MGSVIDCFMLEPSDQQEVSLRRYVGFREEGPCPASGLRYHNAKVVIERRPFEEAACGDSHPHDDPRWPKQCPCGRAFRDDDHWQWSVLTLYRRSDTGELIVLEDAPPGAMWYADWYSDTWKGPDGRCLVVKTPAGEWVADAPSSNGTGWTRTGTPPKVTARPSIGQKKLDGPGWRYHGFLTNGQLVEC